MPAKYAEYAKIVSEMLVDRVFDVFSRVLRVSRAIFPLIASGEKTKIEGRRVLQYRIASGEKCDTAPLGHLLARWTRRQRSKQALTLLRAVPIFLYYSPEAIQYCSREFFFPIFFHLTAERLCSASPPAKNAAQRDAPIFRSAEAEL